MCPPVESPPHAEISLFSTDAQIISLLNEYTPKFHLPNNVLADMNPYQYPPSNLPEGIWYLVHPNEENEAVHGFWKPIGDTSKFYSNLTVTGWRTTLQYFEGQAPDKRRTSWRMHKYWITRKEICDKDKPEESRFLCRVFCNDYSSIHEKHRQNYITIIQPEEINHLASIKSNADVNPGEDCGNGSLTKREHEVATDNKGDSCQQLFPELEGIQRGESEASKKPNSSHEVYSDVECFNKGDYLELADLEDNDSRSSSSRNSSCLSESSGEEFDVSAFLREIEEDEFNSTRGQQSNSRYEFSSVLPDDMVLEPPPSGALLVSSVENNIAESSQSGLTAQETSTDKRELENSKKGYNPDSPTEGTSNAMAGRERKPSDSGRMKKLKTYFCFKPF